MARITNSLFEAIQRVSSGEQDSSVQEGSVDKAHFCATHVEHAFLGYGECISEDHAEPDENGNIAWYKVQFPTGIQRVNSDQLRIVEGKSHTHSKKMAEGRADAAFAELDKEIDKKQKGDNTPTPIEPKRASEIPGKSIKLKDMNPLDRAQWEKEKRNAGIQEKKLDSVGKETADIDNDGDTDKSDSYLHNRRKAIGKAIKKEEVEQVDEISRKTLGSYVRKASDKAREHAFYGGVAFTKGKLGQRDYHAKKEEKRDRGIYKATDRLAKEDTSMMRTGNVPKKSKNPGTAAFNWKGQKPESKFEKKQTATGTVYTRKQDKETNEGKTLTIINHNNFVLEVTDNPTFKDYFDALQMIAPTNDENIQQEMVTIATEAFNEGYKEIIAEAMMKTAYLDTVASYTKQGYKLVDESYTVADDEVYAEYMMEKDGSYYQYIYTGDIVPEEKE